MPVGMAISKPKFTSRKKRKEAAAAAVEAAAAQAAAGSAPVVTPSPQEPIVRDTKEVVVPSWRLEKEKQAFVAEPDQKAFAKTWIQKSRGEMTDRDWHVMMQDLSISITPEVPSARPLLQFQDLPSPFASKTRELGYKTPTPIQRAAIPIGLSGRNIAAVAETGSGKTVGFLVPIIHKLSEGPGSIGLILAPTRELAIQIGDEATKFADFPIAIVVGGRGIEEQAGSLPDARLVIATPGRLLDCLNQGMVSLRHCDLLVLDEADRMIDMGFEEQVTEILGALPPVRQTLMFTATWPASIETLARKLNPDMVKIEVAPAQRGRVTHSIEEIEPGPKRIKRLIQVVKKPGKVIVFASKKVDCDAIEQALITSQVRAVAMHGSKDQSHRELALADFKSGKASVLVATDVAGRGIDIPDVALVVNYDMPRSLATWVHRIGRTGRAGKSGSTVSFVDQHDHGLYPQLRTYLRESSQRIPEFLKV